MSDDRYKRSVTILGLCIVRDNVSDIVRSINETKKVYTLNDFYRPIAFPWLDKECCDLTVFQIHEKLENVPEGRFQQWISEYNERANRVVVTSGWKGLRNGVEFPIDEALALFPVGWFQSSFGYMTAYAYLNGMRDFRFFGFSLREADHYKDSIPGCLYILDTLRKMNCKVTCPMENQWRESMNINNVDWTKIPNTDIMYGSYAKRKLNFSYD